MSMINLFFFLAIIGYVAIWHNYVMGFLFLIFLMVMEIIGFGMTHAMFLVACELTAAMFLVREGQTRKDKSPLVKYNPFCKNNVLSKKIQFVIVVIFILASLIRILDLLSYLGRIYD